MTDDTTTTDRICTPWDELDRAFDGGLQRGNLYLIRGHGKTTAALNIAGAAAAQGYAVALYEWEMYGREVQRRLAANYNRVPIPDLDTEHLEAVRTFPIRVPSDRTNKIDVHEPEALLVIDYLDFIPNYRENPHEVLRGLKSLAREQNIAVVATTHLQASDLYQEADAVIHIKPTVRPEFPEMLTGEVTISLVKNRMGRPDVSFLAPWHRDQSRIGATVQRRDPTRDPERLDQVF